MKVIFFALILLLIAGCTSPVEETPKNNTYFFGGESVLFEYENTNISLDGSIMIESANYTGDIYVHSFCDVPFNLLIKRGTSWKYIFPDYLECLEPIPMTLEIGKEFPIKEIPLRAGQNIEPGTYLVKIYYSTFSPDEYLRESDTIIEIK